MEKRAKIFVYTVARSISADLAVHPKGDQHDEEEDGPQRGDGHFGHGEWVYDKRQGGAALGDITHGEVHVVRQVAQVGEDDEAGENTGQAVTERHYQGISVQNYKDWWREKNINIIQNVVKLL